MDKRLGSQGMAFWFVFESFGASCWLIDDKKQRGMIIKQMI
jgi:hypothetical protein